jgi:hypothetical protein
VLRLDYESLSYAPNVVGGVFVPVIGVESVANRSRTAVGTTNGDEPQFQSRNTTPTTMITSRAYPILPLGNDASPNGQGATSLRNEPRSSGSAESSPPEFFRLPRTGERDPFFGLSRSTYYQWEKSGLIGLRRVRARGALRGITWVAYDQIAELISASAATSPDGLN